MRTRKKRARSVAFDAGVYLTELHQCVTVAQNNYEIWWTYRGEHTRPVFVEAMNRHPVFFPLSIHAHFVTLIVFLYWLYETRPETCSIPRFIWLLREKRLLEEEILKNLETMCGETVPHWRKVVLLRNEVYGHRSASRSVEDVFTAADVSPNDLKTLIEKTKGLMNALTLELDGSVHAFDEAAGRDLRLLLGDIKRKA